MQHKHTKMTYAQMTLFIGSGRIALAHAHAKLSLRTQVLEEDAVIAVLLCESSVTLKHG